MRFWGRAALVAMFLSLMGIGTAIGPHEAWTAEKKPEKKKEMPLRDRLALPSHVQMRAMMVPIKHRYQSVSAITMFLEADVRKEVGAICRKVPRIRDAILSVLSIEPIPTRKGKLVLTGVAERLIGRINKRLGETTVRSIHIEPGLVRMGGGDGISRRPFATINGCQGIKEIELDIVKEEQKKKREEQ